MTTSQTAKGNNNTQVNIQEFNANLNNITSIIASVVPKIASLTASSEANASDITAYEFDAKISYNNVNTFKEILDEYGQYGPQIDSVYEEYDNERPGFKDSVFRYFKTKYLLKKQQLHTENPTQEILSIVRANSDQIMRSIFEEFKTELKSSNNLTLSIEEVDTCALAVTCHAFFQCKILEKPKP